MIHRAGHFLRRSLLGGVVILLPMAIVGFFFKWLYQTVTGMISPLTSVLIRESGMPQLAADWLVVLLLLLFCFVVGRLVTTRLGGWLWQRTEQRLMVRVPGYRMVREIINQLTGSSSESPFKRGQVARVWLMGRDVDVSVSALVTAWHGDGRVTVFVPTGPNPTSGFIYHVDSELVTLYPDASLEQMMKSVVACGAGSAQLFGGATPQRAVPPERPTE